MNVKQLRKNKLVGKGRGEALVTHAVELARVAGCYKVTLTSNKGREDAHRFYRRLGFNATNEGFRLALLSVAKDAERSEYRIHA